MKSVISSFELSLYFFAWISANVCGLYNYFVVQNDILENNPHLKRSLQDLSPGWDFLERDKDVADVEWSTLKFYFQTSWFYMLIQCFVSELLRKSWPSLLKYWFILSSIIFVNFYMGFSQMVIVLSQPIVFYIIIILGGKKITIWLTSTIILLSYNTLKYNHHFLEFLDRDNLQDEELYLLLFAIAWIELKCISFSIDYVERVEKVMNSNRKEQMPSKYETILSLFSYVLYLPLMYLGPIMLYEDFQSSFHDENQAKLIPRLKRFAVDITLFLIYSVLFELALHFIYVYAMQGNLETIRRLPALALCGAGLWMGFQFQVKYVVSYGISAAFARLDNMNPPPTPRCIARIHVYSQMWRYFDVGLYKFLVKYIYKPGYNSLAQNIALSKFTYKLIATFSTFLFIFAWHGIIWSIFVWAVLNFIGILLESSAKAISVTDTYKRFKQKVLKSDAMEVRFVALLCGPLLVLSAISNFYLFSGSEVGDMYFRHLKSALGYDLAIVMIAVYCCSHVSMYLKNVPSRTDVKRLTKAD